MSKVKKGLLWWGVGVVVATIARRMLLAGSETSILVSMKALVKKFDRARSR